MWWTSHASWRYPAGTLGDITITCALPPRCTLPTTWSPRRKSCTCFRRPSTGHSPNSNNRKTSGYLNNCWNKSKEIDRYNDARRSRRQSTSLSSLFKNAGHSRNSSHLGFMPMWESTGASTTAGHRVSFRSTSKTSSVLRYTIQLQIWKIAATLSHFPRT